MTIYLNFFMFRLVISGHECLGVRCAGGRPEPSYQVHLNHYARCTLQAWPAMGAAIIYTAKISLVYGIKSYYAMPRKCFLNSKLNVNHILTKERSFEGPQENICSYPEMTIQIFRIRILLICMHNLFQLLATWLFFFINMPKCSKIM
jgi:hypothetical protein